MSVLLSCQKQTDLWLISDVSVSEQQESGPGHFHMYQMHHVRCFSSLSLNISSNSASTKTLVQRHGADQKQCLNNKIKTLNLRKSEQLKTSEIISLSSKISPGRFLEITFLLLDLIIRLESKVNHLKIN